MSFESRLKKLNTTYKAAMKREPKGGFGEFPLEDGKYIGRITDIELGESQSSGRVQVMIEFTVSDGPDTGTVVKSYDGLETEDGIFFFGQKLARLGATLPEKFEDVPAVCAKVLKGKPVVKFRVKTKDDFHNVYIEKLLGGEDLDTSGADDAGSGPGNEPVGDPGDEGGVELEVGAEVVVEMADGSKASVTVTKIVDDETFKGKIDNAGKEKVFSADQIRIGETAGEPEGVTLEKGSEVTVKIGKKNVAVTVTKIIDDETFKAITPDDKVVTLTTADIV